VPELLVNSDYVSTLPSRFAERHKKRLDLFELPFEARGFTLFAAWHPRNHVDPALVWLRETLTDLAAA
jgi:DNA-binding transcriptional LysR family regulator